MYRYTRYQGIQYYPYTVYLTKIINKCLIYQLIAIIFVEINIFNYNKIIYSHKSYNSYTENKKLLEQKLLGAVG